MSNFSHYVFQKAVYEALTADSTLSGMVSGIFDRPPQDTAYPYVTLGDMSGQDWSSKTSAGMEYTLSLYVWSREGGRKEAALIMERIHALLHDGTLAPEGQTLVMMRFTGSSISLEHDGSTYQGHMRFRALLEAD